MCWIFSAFVAVCCSVLQCVAVCCGVLRCVAVRCSVLHLYKMHANSCRRGLFVVPDDEMTSHVVYHRLHSVCHRHTVYVTDTQCMSQTHSVCHRHTVYVTDTPCIAFTHSVCHRHTVYVTDTPCIAFTHSVCHRHTVPDDEMTSHVVWCRRQMQTVNLGLFCKRALWKRRYSDADVRCRQWHLTSASHYGVATCGRLLKILGLFCKRALWKRLYSAKLSASDYMPVASDVCIRLHDMSLRKMTR